MPSKEKQVNVYVTILAVFAATAVVWAIRGFNVDRIDAVFLTLALLTVFCSCFLPVAMPRIIEWTMAYGLIIVSLLLYGGEITVILAVLTALLTSFMVPNRSGSPGTRNSLVMSSCAAIGVFLSTKLISVAFGSAELVLQRSDSTGFVWLVVAIMLTLFVINSVLTATLGSLQGGWSFGKSWSRTWFRSAVTFTTAAIVAGLLYRSFEYVNIYIEAAGIIVLGTVFIAFRRQSENARIKVEKATRAERYRAEQAENSVQELVQYVAELENNSEALEESHEKFRRAAYHDALTGLPNRNYFLDTLKVLLKQSQDDSESNFAVLILDLKSFKTINDSLGHSMGDRLIKNVAKRVSGLIREQDLVGRFSGDKFGIVLTDLLSREEATTFADRLAKRLAEPYTLDGRQVFTSAKIGIAYGNSSYPEAEEILRDADIAMYYAKDNKENYVIFDQKMHIRAVTRLQLETDLRFAIERNEFELFYQPIVGLETASLVGFEALVRWNHPQRGLVPPNEFIAISESTGLIIPMTVQILHSACAQVAKWQKLANTDQPLSVAVNLSGKHFGHPALVEQIKTVLAETGIEPSSLKLELTESAVMDNAETAILMLKQIKETGVQISIDDFGTGYSSLSYLHRFPIDLLKVDRSFVSAMEENSENGEIVRTVVALAKALNLKVVAEGIESIHQFHQLRILGCEYGQGFLFSKPLQVGDIERLLNDETRWQSILPLSARNLAIPQVPETPHLRLAL